MSEAEHEAMMGRVTLEVEVANHGDELEAERGKLDPSSVRRMVLPAIVDTGAMHAAIPGFVARQLGLSVAGSARVRYADERASSREVVRDLGIKVLGRTGDFRAIVEPDRKEILLGAIVLEDLDLLVDCANQKLVPRDPAGIVAIIE